MKYKVIKKFRDKYTKETYKIGKIIDVTKKRASEINNSPEAPFIREVQKKRGE